MTRNVRCIQEYPKPWGWQPAPCPDVCGAVPDWNFSNCELQVYNELNDYVMITLFTDAKDNTRPLGQKGGWWGAKYFDTPPGTRLWTLKGKPINDATLLAAERYIREGLRPLTEIKAVGGYDVTVDLGEDGQPTVEIEIYGQLGDSIYSTRFARLWE